MWTPVYFIPPDKFSKTKIQSKSKLLFIVCVKASFYDKTFCVVSIKSMDHVSKTHLDGCYILKQCLFSLFTQRGHFTGDVLQRVRH